MEKNSFVVYYSYRDTLADLTDEQVGRLFRALLTYEIDGIEPTFEAELKIAFKFIKKDMDINQTKYENICTRNRENGKKGGRPKNPENPVGYLETQENPEKPKKADDDNDDDNENDIYNIYCAILECWNSQKIIKHKALTEPIKKAIDSALKTYTCEQIKEFISRYAKVLNDSQYTFKYKWTLVEFLKRQNAISSFADEGSKWQNYCFWKDNLEKTGFERSYSQGELNTVFTDLDNVEV